MQQNPKGLTVSVVFQANSANYGEGLGNVATLKKLTRGDGHQYSYISRQALRYNIVKEMGADDTPLDANGSKDKAVIQYAKDATIEKYPEIDLFGYMKTEKSKSAATRSAVVRLSNAIAQEYYDGDTDFLTNQGLTNRISYATGKQYNNNIAESEIQESYYAYTLTIDLDRVGEDDNDNVHLDDAEKNRRVAKLLSAIQYLYRDIRGRREDLKPLFVIGGIYDIKNPFFANAIKVSDNKLDLSAIKSVLADANVAKNTQTGLVDGIFDNSDEVKVELQAVNTAQFMNDLKKKVADYYEVQGD